MRSIVKKDIDSWKTPASMDKEVRKAEEASPESQMRLSVVYLTVRGFAEFCRAFSSSGKGFNKMIFDLPQAADGSDCEAIGHKIAERLKQDALAEAPVHGAEVVALVIWVIKADRRSLTVHYTFRNACC